MTKIKYCKDCDRNLPISNFHIDNSSKDGFIRYCKECQAVRKKMWVNSKRDSASKFNIEVNTLREMLSNGCEICKTTEKRLVVDHDHNCCSGDFSCGKCVRGVLCDSCNRGIGFFLDDTRLLESAIAFLKNSGNRKGTFPPYIKTHIKKTVQEELYG